LGSIFLPSRNTRPRAYQKNLLPAQNKQSSKVRKTPPFWGKTGFLTPGKFFEKKVQKKLDNFSSPWYHVLVDEARHFPSESLLHLVKFTSPHVQAHGRSPQASQVGR
jgi:hypothetical protein